MSVCNVIFVWLCVVVLGVVMNVVVVFDVCIDIYYVVWCMWVVFDFLVFV